MIKTPERCNASARRPSGACWDIFEVPLLRVYVRTTPNRSPSTTQGDHRFAGLRRSEPDRSGRAVAGDPDSRHPANGGRQTENVDQNANGGAVELGANPRIQVHRNLPKGTAFTRYAMALAARAAT